MCEIGPTVYDLISSCESAKKIWDLLRIMYEVTEETRLDLTGDVDQKEYTETDYSLDSKVS